MRMPNRVGKVFAIPQDAGTDNALMLLNEGYTYISRRCEGLGSEAFATRMMLQLVFCMLGAEAVRLFYDGERFTRPRRRIATAARLARRRDRQSQ